MTKRPVAKFGQVRDLFSSGPVKNIKSRVLLDDVIVKGPLKSDDEVDEKHFQDLILKRIIVNEKFSC